MLSYSYSIAAVSIERELILAGIEFEPKKAKAAKRKTMKSFADLENIFTKPLMQKANDEDLDSKERILKKINKGLKTGNNDNMKSIDKE